MIHLILAILLGSFPFVEYAEATSLSKPPLYSATSAYFQTDSLFAPGDSAHFSNQSKNKLKESRLYRKFETFGKYRVLLYVALLIGGILLLRFSAFLIRITDKLLLRISHRPNTFNGYRFTGNPFILKGPFYALYHLFLGKGAYLSYLVWPLKYFIAISFFSTIVIRLLPEEAFHTIQNLKALLFNSLSVQIVFGLIFLMYMTVFTLLCIESIRKTKWLFPLRVITFLLIGMVISAFMYKLFWPIVVIAILYLLTYMGKDFISRQRIADEQGYSKEDFIYEPWPDGSQKVYPKT